MRANGLRTIFYLLEYQPEKTIEALNRYVISLCLVLFGWKSLDSIISKYDFNIVSRIKVKFIGVSSL